MKLARLFKIAQNLAWVHNKFDYCDKRAIEAMEEAKEKLSEALLNENNIEAFDFINKRLRVVEDQLHGTRHQSKYIGWNEDEHSLLMSSRVIDIDKIEMAVKLGIIGGDGLDVDVEELQKELELKLDILKKDKDLLK